MASTTNYSWSTPDDTALVKDGASAIRTLGSSIDTTTKNLNPSTTLGDIEYRSSTANVNTRLPLGTAGQVLKVNSGATAPEWATDATGMTNPMTTTGDTIYSSSGSTPARLAIGSTGNVLTVAGGVPTWAAPSSGGMTLLSTTTLSGATTTISSISQDYFNLQIDIFGITNDTANGYFYIQFNSNGTNNKTIRNLTTTTWSSNDNTLDLNEGTDNNTKYSRNSPDGGWTVYVPNYTLSTGYNAYTFSGVYGNVNGDKVPVLGGGGFSVNGAITSMLIGSTGGNFSAGTVKIYGVK